MNTRQIIAENDGAFYFLVFDNSEAWDYFMDLVEAFDLVDISKWAISLPSASVKEKILLKTKTITIKDLTLLDISLREQDSPKDLRLILKDFTNKFHIFNNFSEEGETE